MLFPIYARALQPADYGAMSLLATVCSAVSMLGLMGMNNSVQRFFFDERDPAMQQRIWSTGFLASLALTVAAVLVAGLLLWALKDYQPALSGWPAALALAAMVPQIVVIWLQDQARLQFRPLRFATVAVAQAVLGGVAGILFVAVWHWALPGFFAAGLLAAIATALAAMFTARSFWPLTFSRRELRRLIRFGAPFVPAGVFIWLSSAVLRWMLAGSKGLAEAGMFDVAWKLAAPIWMLNIAVGQAFGPYAFRLRAEDPDYRTKLVDALHAIGVVTLFAACGVMLFARELCVWIASAAYELAAGPCGILALGFCFSATHQVTALGIAFTEKSHWVAVGWGGAALASAGLAFWFVPALGASGAAWCVVLAYAGLTFFYAMCTQRLHPLPFRLGPLAVQLALGVLTVAFALTMQRQALSVTAAGIKLLWWVAAAAVLMVWGGVEPRQLVAMLARLPGIAPRRA